MVAKCPSCKSNIGISGWRTEELKKSGNFEIKATVIYCDSCKAILTIIPK